MPLSDPAETAQGYVHVSVQIFMCRSSTQNHKPGTNKTTMVLYHSDISVKLWRSSCYFSHLRPLSSDHISYLTEKGSEQMCNKPMTHFSSYLKSLPLHLKLILLGSNADPLLHLAIFCFINCSLKNCISVSPSFRP